MYHSVVVGETNNNRGFNLPWWDRLFGAYRAQPGLAQLPATQLSATISQTMAVAGSSPRFQNQCTVPRSSIIASASAAL